MRKLSLIFTGSPVYMEESSKARTVQKEEQELERRIQRAQRSAAHNRFQASTKKSGNFFCCASDSTIRRDVNMSAASPSTPAIPVPIKEIAYSKNGASPGHYLATHQSSVYDGPKCRILDTEAIIQERVSERLSFEMNSIKN